MSYAEHIQEHVRLAILQVLGQSAGYSTNSIMLRTSLEQLGYMVSGDQVRGEVTWLAEQRLITTIEPGGAAIVATLTERGHDVSKGISQFPGVKRPLPGG